MKKSINNHYFCRFRPFFNTYFQFMSNIWLDPLGISLIKVSDLHEIRYIEQFSHLLFHNSQINQRINHLPLILLLQLKNPRYKSSTYFPATKSKCLNRLSFTTSIAILHSVITSGQLIVAIASTRNPMVRRCLLTRSPMVRRNL